MEIKHFEFNIFGENTYLIWDSTSLDAAVIDPGMADGVDVRTFMDVVEEKSLSLRFILLTHIHIDHTFGVDALKEQYPLLPVLAHRGDLGLAASRSQQAQMFHLPYKLRPLEIDRFVDEKTSLNLGPEEIKVICTPGHSAGGVCYYLPSSGILFSGDTLFAGSIGRADLPGGNGRQLIFSIQEKLMKLPDNTIVLPGHGSPTSILREKQSNPYLL
ncbi:MAG: MBL fold metallo-hydrolase [Bacteroidales bacterium]|nr:MBL fold metallo-hydrolase [Bacteroidales bacterium]